MPASNVSRTRTDWVSKRTRTRARMLAALNPSAASPWLQAPHAQTKPASRRPALASPQSQPVVLPQPLRNESTQPDTERRLRMRTLAATVASMSTLQARQALHKQAKANLERWQAAAAPAAAAATATGPVLILKQMDTLDLAKKLTVAYGTTFAVLNMANGSVFGGGYLSGSAAQEENMFRRTDCHFSARLNELVPTCFPGAGLRYNRETSDLINANAASRVYISTDAAHTRLKPRICIRGPEVYTDRDLGYPQLPDHEVFGFYELRSAAEDLTGRLHTSTAKLKAEMRRRIRAQLDTLVAWKVRHVVLSAFGCGAFLHSATDVALAYADLLSEYAPHFDVVAFGIYYAGWGKNNFDEFAAAFRSHPTLGACYHGDTPATLAPAPEPESEPESEAETELNELDADWACDVHDPWGSDDEERYYDGPAPRHDPSPRVHCYGDEAAYEMYAEQEDSQESLTNGLDNMMYL